MKTTILFITVLFNSCYFIAQDMNYQIQINGKPNQLALSKSKENFITLDGTCCDQFVISVNHMSIQKHKNGFLGIPSNANKFATIIVDGIQDGKRIALGKMQYTIVD